jgi:hypothetical protein
METTTTTTTPNTTKAVAEQSLSGKEKADKLREERLAKLGRLKQKQQ